MHRLPRRGKNPCHRLFFKEFASTAMALNKLKYTKQAGRAGLNEINGNFWSNKAGSRLHLSRTTLILFLRSSSNFAEVLEMDSHWGPTRSRIQNRSQAKEIIGQFHDLSTARRVWPHLVGDIGFEEVFIDTRFLWALALHLMLDHLSYAMPRGEPAWPNLVQKRLHSLCRSPLRSGQLSRVGYRNKEWTASMNRRRRDGSFLASSMNAQLSR
jgi:hypothetical protein